MFSKQNFKMYQYGCVQNWILLDCHFMRNFNFFFWFWFNGKTCQNVNFSYDTSSVFHSIPIIASEFWNPKKQRKTGGRNKMCQNHLLFPPLPQTHESALANSAFSNVVIGIGLLVYYYFHAIVGTFLAGPCGDELFSGKAQSLHLNVGCNLLFPLKGRFRMVFCMFICGFVSFLLPVRDLGHFADGVFGRNGSCCSLQALGHPAGLGAWAMEFQGLLYSESC